MIQPHGSAELKPLYVYDNARRQALAKEAETLPSLLLNSAAAANAVMLGAGYFKSGVPDTVRTGVEIRDEMKKRGWNKVVAFQTRNPMHRAHEELCRMAMERLKADGIVVHMLLGKLKGGDIPANVRNDCINKVVQPDLPKNSVL